MALSLYDLSNDKSIKTGGNGATADLTSLGITVTASEINYLAGITSNIQEQINSIGSSGGGLGTVKTATITTTWVGTTAPYTQDITINGFTTDSTPIINPLYSETNATAILQKEAWNMIGKITASTDKITVVCFEEKPAIELTIQLIGG